MTFADLFKHGLDYNLSSPRETIMLFMPSDIPIDPESSKYLLFILAGGKLSVPQGAHFSMRHLPSYCLIHSLSGNGSFRTMEQTINLLPGSLLFADCRQPHSIMAITPLKYEVVYFDGQTSLLYYDRLEKMNALFLAQNNEMKSISSLCDKLIHNYTYTDVFMVHKFLTDILTGLIQTTEKTDVAPIPSWLLLIRKELENNYYMSFTLDQLESNFHMSKYRICKDFGHHFHMPPMQYLHNVRIQNAQSLLRDTTLKIYEIGYQVGYENVNHFIHQFKKIAGVTPAVYRSNKI